VVLAGLAALRAGAGKLQLAVGRSIAVDLALAIPEGRAFGLPECANGGVAVAAVDTILEWAAAARCVLAGPGMLAEDATARRLVARFGALADTTLVLDAGAITAQAGRLAPLRRLGGRVVLTPHAGEMATLLDVEAAEVERGPAAFAIRAAADTGAVVALKGAETYVATPEGALYRNRAGNVGLATSGSGDVLAGIIAGLAARGAPAVQAAVWGVYLHARAGDALARRIGPLGFLARELLAEIPRLLATSGAGRENAKRGAGRTA
jgi:hydroxyethylthiazole kinase-like uncharacterized protein yjeF